MIGKRTRTLLLALVAAGCGGDERRADRPGRTLPFPEPPPPAERRVSPDDFAGAEACAGCHAEQYRAWTASTHGRAGGPPGPDLVIAPFDGRPMRFADAAVVPRIRSGIYEFVVRQDGFDERVFQVDGVIGRGHMLGGGTQGFVTRMPDGTERFLPWDWSRQAATWFCNTGSRLARGWVPITSEMRLAACGDWPPTRPLGTIARYANCQECHGSRILTTLEPMSGYRTERATLRVDCESCHGPARRHVELMASGAEPGADIGIGSLVGLDKDASLEVCFRCHALKDVLKEGYLPGEPLEEYYALKFPSLGDDPYLADGRVRTFAYQANHLASACYLEGPMDCVSCHEPHGQGYQDIARRPLSGPYDDGQCTSCHPSKLVDVEAHTFHPAGTEASRCVTCHMPYLQHPEVGDGVPFARSDHTIPVPRPAFDADLGIRGACVRCHEDRSALELQRQAQAWWGELKPHRPLVDGLVGELRARNVAEAAELLLRPDETDPLIQFQALGRLLVGYLRPDDDALPSSVVEELRALAASRDLDIRALALAALHWTRGHDPSVRRELVSALADAPNDPALRGRWRLALGFLGDLARDGGEFDRGRIAYAKALEIAPEHPDVLQALGLLHSAEGAHADAVDAFRESLEVDPAQPLGWVNLGIALAAAGDVAGARTAYQEAIRLNPWEPLAHFNLGNLHQRAGNLEGAAGAYRRAVAADPGLGQAHFELARTLIRLGRPAEALPHARRAVEFLPDHPFSRQMLEDLQDVVVG